MTPCGRAAVGLMALMPLFGQAPGRPAPPAGNAAEAGRLPITRVVLYKNGVGYFEHLGRVQGSQEVTISFTSGQLNDVLKSLTVLDLDGGRITGVAYNSATPADRRMDDLRLPVGEKASVTEFLSALRGARVEVRSGATAVTGRVLSVERKSRATGGTTTEVDSLTLLTEAGELRTTELSPSFSVRLLERGLAGKVDRYLDVASSTREADVRRMAVSTEGSGERSVFVSYISEAPVWKTTYRLVMGAKAGQKPLLQGWAIVDNTVGQDWDRVRLSLVAGAPQSFIQNLSQPYYARRPTVAPPESANLSPQTYEATLTASGASLSGRVTDASGAGVPNVEVWAYNADGLQAGSARTDAGGAYEFPALVDGVYRLEVMAPGFRRAVLTDAVASMARPGRRDVRLSVGEVTETVTVTAEVPRVQTDAAVQGRGVGSGRGLSSGAGLGRIGAGSGSGVGQGSGTGFGPGSNSLDELLARAGTAARAQDVGDLFEYTLKDPITILRNRSALVPIVQSPVAVEKVSIWNDQMGLSRPMRGLWLTNTSGLTLDRGSFSVMEEETFAGEGILDPIRPGEKRLLSYATDLAVAAGARSEREPQKVTRVRVSRGVLTQESQLVERKVYTFRNEDSTPRTVIVEHPARTGYALRGSAQPVETTAGWMRFRVPVEPKQTATLAVEEARPVEATVALTSLTSDQVALFVRQRSVNAAVEQALRRVLAQKDVVGEVGDQRAAREKETERIFDDQQRLRENMKALKGSPDEKALLQRYTQQLNEQESRLEALRKEAETLEAREAEEQAKLDRLIQEIAVEGDV